MEIDKYCLIFLAERLSELLMFATGCRVIPPMGFSKSSLITVLQNDSSLPNANTCPMELEVPGLVDTYEEFKININCALNNQKEGFGHNLIIHLTFYVHLRTMPLVKMEKS